MHMSGVKEKALLLSIDPMDKLKIARSHRLAGRIDPTPYYKKRRVYRMERFTRGW